MTIKRTKTGHTAARAKRQRPVAAKVARALIGAPVKKKPPKKRTPRAAASKHPQGA